MLLCVAGGGSSGFSRDRSREGSHCSAQSAFTKNNAKQQVMVDERCSMTSTAVNVPQDLTTTQESLCLDLRKSRSFHNKPSESSLAVRGKVIVVRGDDVVCESTENEETCATTTTFKSNIVNGKRSTNTILVRYKSSKSLSQSSDICQNESGGRNEGFQEYHKSVSSPSSTASSENSTSSQNDKISTSAWAQIMELEGYRSPAIGLDKLPDKDDDNISDTESIDVFTPVHCESLKCYSGDNVCNNGGEVAFPESNCSYINSSARKTIESNNLKSSVSLNKDLDRSVVQYNSSFPVASHAPEASFTAFSEVNHLKNKSNWHILKAEVCDKAESSYGNSSSDCNDKISEDSLTLHCSLPNEKSCIRIAQKVKSPMYRSESSRVTKATPLEKNKSRRKTLPDGNLHFSNGNSQEIKCANKKQISIDVDPNASWGRYNAKAMRESVRKVAQKYSETAYLKRQTHSKFDAITDVKGVQLTKFVSPYTCQDHLHSSTTSQYHQNNLFCSRVPSIPSHLHHVAPETDSILSTRHNLHLIAPTSTHHDHDISIKEYLMNFSRRKRDSVEHVMKLDHNPYIHSDKTFAENESTRSANSQVNNGSKHSSLFNCDISRSTNAYNFNYPMCENCSKSKMCTDSYQSPKCVNFIQNEDLSVRSSDTVDKLYSSVYIHDIKSKLCSNCAQAAEYGPPSKHSASRTKCHKTRNSLLNSSNLSSPLSLSKESPSGINNTYSNLSDHSLYLSKDDCKSNSVKCGTLLTAREMSDLVHGNNPEKLADNRIPLSGVTSKVTNWIQKQRDKRKPVFFIGDAPTYISSNYEEGDTPNRALTRKSKRSLSLSSVREDEISSNCKSFAESSLNLSVVRLNPSACDDRDYEHKHLYIKRASSCCSNRGSIRRKIRQGSPVREEKESVAKNLNDPRNQVDGCIASGSKCQNYRVKNKLSLDNDPDKKEDSNFKQESLSTLNSQYALPIHEYSLNEINQSKNKFTSDINVKTEFSEQKDRENEELISNNSACKNAESLNEVKSERSSFSKRLLHIKQLTRALSLHSLKKKNKESVGESPSNKARAEEPAISAHFSKWYRNSKRKLNDSKYGSLRKSMSYCELTVREATTSSKSISQINAYTEIKRDPKSSARTSVPFMNYVCCSATIRRSVSLYWKFPLSRCLEYSVEDTNSDFLARLCFSRLYSRNRVPPFVRQLKNRHSVSKMKDSDNSRTTDERNLHLMDTPPHDQCDRIPVIILKPEDKVLTIKNVPFSEEKHLNGNDGKSWKPDIIMGLGSNHALNDPINCNRVKMVEEYVPFENSTDTMDNHLPPLAVNKGKASTGLRLRSKATSRSERHAKGKSTSELCGRTIRKTVSDALDSRRRPSSQFYDLDELDSTSDPSNGPNLLQLSSASSGSQPILCAPDQTSDIPHGSSGLTTRHLPLHTSTPQLSPADSLLQRFRKSFALRFQKKKPDPVSSAPKPEILSTTVEAPELSIPNSNDQINIADEILVNNILNDSKSPTGADNLKDLKKLEENKDNFHSNPKQVHLLLSDGRKKTRRKADWRLSLIYDSVDSIFDSSTKSSLNKCRAMPNFTGSDANILRKRAASTSDYSPKSKAIQRPMSVADYLTLDNTPCTKVPDGQNDLTTDPDTTSSEEQQKNLTSLDQIWRANPVKLCRVHSRLLMCRHKGRYRLRRSISQPVELEMTGSVHNLRDSTHGSSDHENFQKGSLSSDDEASSESDIYHSYCCSPTRRSNTCWELSGDGTMYAEALWDHETIDPEELPFLAGDIIEVTDTSDQDWWWGTKDGHGGWFPSAFVRLYVSHRTPSLHYNGQQSDRIQIPYSPCKVSMNNLSCEQVRANIVQEIVATERDYVKHLKDVVEGYLKQVHRRPDMFSKERIETVFGNIKEIYTFQSQFLKQLEECLDKDAPNLSQIGNCFLNHKEEFKMYSQYCNNHPLAVSELQELYCDSQYIHFFEACRLLQEMIDISLDGFLLTPIQRICKYPLQLAELLKFTDENHPDHVPVTNALAAMKDVAELVNERKRRMECLERIAEWQSTIEGWEGPDVLDTSSILIHCGEVTRVSSSWSRDIYLFIFDHQLIYCKKDLLKRHTYAYKGRLNLDHCDIVDIEDGKDSQFAVNIKNAWKIYCKDKDKWYLFYAKTSPEKDQWLCAFKAERQRVIDDEKQAFVVTEEAKKSARLAVHNKQKPKRPRAKFTKGRRCHPDVAVTELLLDSPSAKARSGSLPSNIHPELAIMTGAKLGPTRKKGSGWFHFGSGKKPKS